MPLVMHDYDVAFLHPMKTGGTWVRNALTAAGVRWQDVGYQHHSLAEASRYLSAETRYLTTVRNPLRWYRSFWSFREAGGWGGNLVLGHDCIDHSFDHFVLAATKRHPGYLTEYLDQFVGPDVYVMRTISLADDLVTSLRRFGVAFDEAALRTTPPANAAKDLPGVSPVISSIIVQSEWRLFLKYSFPLTIEDGE